MTVPRKKVLFICTHNSARSQMAEGLLNSLMRDRHQAFTAGTRPGGVSPYVVRAMAERGMDISGNRSKGLDEFDGRYFDIVVTVCSDEDETCPFFPGREHMHRAFEDPSTFTGTEEEMMAKVRVALDGI